MKVKLIAVTQPLLLNGSISNQEQLIEYAGRKCTNTTEKTGRNTNIFIRTRIRQGHTSILEHVSFTFEIDGISRACLAQLTRHRIASFSVQSMRYVLQEYAHDLVTIPNHISDITFYKKTIQNSFNAYHTLIERGVNKEDARMVLPLATHTNLIMTINARSLLNFFELRCSESAQWEIRKLANKMKRIVKEYLPSVF